MKTVIELGDISLTFNVRAMPFEELTVPIFHEKIDGTTFYCSVTKKPYEPFARTPFPTPSGSVITRSIWQCDERLDFNKTIKLIQLFGFPNIPDCPKQSNLMPEFIAIVEREQLSDHLFLSSISDDMLEIYSSKKLPLVLRKEVLAISSRNVRLADPMFLTAKQAFSLGLL